MNNDKNRDKNAKPYDANPANRDPITGTPGAHPVGAGLGAAAGGAAGAAIGAIGGPIGAAAGAVIGGVAGGYGGKAAAESIDPTVEGAYWRDNYSTRPYVDASLDYTADYEPAYRYGWENVEANRGKSFDDVEPNLRRNWDRSRSGSSLSWERAKDAVKDAWDRLTGKDDADRNRRAR